MKQHNTQRRTPQAGFTLIEALIALLVMSFGMLALAGMQIAMNRNSDVAKQRSEAVRLAQLKMEQLRSFDSLTVVPGSTYTYAANVVPSVVGTPEVICPTCVAPLDSTTNTTFTRSWTVKRSDGVTDATATDAQKWINVTVVWTDRANQQQSVTLNSVIARNDPIALKSLVGGQARAKVRYPKNRHVNIPYPAVTLSGGNTSAFIPPPGNVIYVFNNDTGNVAQSCTSISYPITSTTRAGTVATALASGHPFVAGNRVSVAGVTPSGYNGEFTVVSAVAGTSFTYTVSSSLATPSTTGGTAARVVDLVEGLDLSTVAGITCTPLDAFLLSGFVRFKTTGAAPTASNIENTTDNTLPLSTSGPLVIDPAATGNGPTAYVCYSQRQKVISAANQLPVAVTSAARTGGVVTVTTASSHGFSVGYHVAIEEAGQFGFNGSFVVASTPTGSTLTYVQPGADGSSSGGKASLIQRLTVEDSVSVSGYNTIISKFIAYTCVVTPGNDGVAVAWWGEARLVTDGSWTAVAAGTHKVCRFSGDYIDDGAVSNHEHPRFYRRVSGTLDNQNYLVINQSDSCPTDVKSDPVAGDFVNTSTVTHQPSASAVLSFKCTNASCSGSNYVPIEFLPATTPAPMFCPLATAGCT